MSVFEVDAVLTVGRAVREVLSGQRSDPRLLPIVDSADIYSAAMNRALLQRLGIENKLWTGNVQWEPASGTADPPASDKHACNVVQLSDRTCWILDNAPVEPFHQRNTNEAVAPSASIKSPEVIFFLTRSKRLDDTTQPGWRWRYQAAASKRTRIYKYKALESMRSLRRIQTSGGLTALQVDRCPEIFTQIQESIEERIRQLLNHGDQSKPSTSLANN
jgi:hypothetical protein